MPRPWLLLLAALLASALALGAAGCAGAGARAEEDPLTIAFDGVPPEHLPALDALRAAVAEHDDLLARRILSRLWLRRPSGRTAALAHAFERVLDGRARVAELELALEGLPDATDGEGFVLWLVATNHGREPVALAPGPATLRLVQHVVTPDGAEQRSARTRGLEPVSVEPIDPGATRRVRLDATRVGFPPGALAVRCRWEIHFRAGRITEGERVLPAQSLVVRPAEWTALAPFLPKEPVEPYELVRYLAGRRVAMPPLMERAVRIAPARYGEALDLLTAHARSMSSWELQRLVPVLRWLADDPGPGGDPAAWKRWLEARAARLLRAGRPLPTPSGAPTEPAPDGPPPDEPAAEDPAAAEPAGEGPHGTR